MLIRGATLLDGRPVDVRCRGSRIAAMAAALAPAPGERVVEARGGALLSGLHDHHLHLYALAAARASVPCGPPEVAGASELVAALAAAQDRPPGGGGWLRGVGYHESVAGELDRRVLDRWVAHRPLRIQHRSGKMWFLNSPALALLGLDRERGPEGVERDARGRATGRLFRLDGWLGRRLASTCPPDLGPVSRELAGYGVSGVTDATAGNGPAALEALAAAARAGQLRQRVLVMGGESLPLPSHPHFSRGALKILLDDHRLPEWDELQGWLAAARRQDRPVAIHCVTRTELIFALAALEAAGSARGDRIEHASVTPDEALPLLRARGVTVVTQPGFIHERGDRYALDVPAPEQPLLYRGRAFLAAGIPLGGSSDAPYGSPDPWLAMRAAVRRRTAGGRVLGPGEALTAERALALFTTAADDPGGAARELRPGAVADLCLLDRPWSAARQLLTHSAVRCTWRGGELIHGEQELSSEARWPTERPGGGGS